MSANNPEFDPVLRRLNSGSYLMGERLIGLESIEKPELKAQLLADQNVTELSQMIMNLIKEEFDWLQKLSSGSYRN